MLGRELRQQQLKPELCLAPIYKKRIFITGFAKKRDVRTINSSPCDLGPPAKTTTRPAVLRKLKTVYLFKILYYKYHIIFYRRKTCASLNQFSESDPRAAKVSIPY